MSGMPLQEPGMRYWALLFTPAPIGLNGSTCRFQDIQKTLLELLTL